MRKRIASIVLSVCLCLSLLPTAVFAEGTSEPTTTTKTLMLGTGGISGYDSTAGYDYIYYGAWNGSPIKWRVLDDQTNTKGDGLFLLSEVLLGTGTSGDVCFQQSYHSGSGENHKGNAPSDDNHTNCQIMNAWQGSDAQAWCKDFAGIEGNSVTDAFSSAELAAILETTKSDGSYNDYYADSNNILNGDKVFFLSGEEALNEDYGFTNGNARIAKYGNNAGVWWLRSPYKWTDRAGAVLANGSVNNTNANNVYAARPAFNLNLNSVLFTSAAEGGKTAGTTGTLSTVSDYSDSEWKLTLLDESRSGFSAELESLSGNTATVSYDNATPGANEYISVIIKNGSTVKYYGRVANVSDASAANGEVKITLPDDFSTANGDVLCVFNEQYNGGEKDDTKLTDYASQLIEVQATVDTTAPALSNGTATRESKTNATVKFTSNEAGEYYYKVVNSGATESTIDTTGTGVTCEATEQTISLDSLTGDDAKDIYIVVKDAAGNVSEKLKITIPAYIAPSYGISASPETLNFGSETVDYEAAPAAQTVTVTNTGNQNVTVTLPTSTNYTITAGTGFTGNTADLTPSGTATFTVQPKSGLSAETYNETITVQGANGDNRTNKVGITASFTVNNQPSSSGSSTPSYPVTAPKADNGTVKVSPRYAERGDIVTVTVTPDEGYLLDTITVLDKNGKEIELIDKGNGKYTFKMPASKVTVNATFAPEKTVTDYFADVSADSYYADAVLWAAKKGVTSGIGNGLFAPDETCTRAQIVTFLWRAAGSPAPKTASGFTDVPNNAYYAKAVAWAVENGITGGIGNNQFAPDQTCTRAQAVAFLFRYAASQGMDAVAPQELVSGYGDAAQVPGYAFSAFNWALANGIVTGNNGNLMPNNDCTRAQIVTMLYRLLGK